jgi:hypothetical protein
MVVPMRLARITRERGLSGAAIDAFSATDDIYSSTLFDRALRRFRDGEFKTDPSAGFFHLILSALRCP